jgi:hypothetical protein
MAFETHIKSSFEDEVADVAIRLFDLCGGLGIDLEKHIELKDEVQFYAWLQTRKGILIWNSITKFYRTSLFGASTPNTIMQKKKRNLEEIADRNMQMHINKFPEFRKRNRKAYTLVYDKKILPSMRSLQFGGKPIEVNNARFLIVVICTLMIIEHLVRLCSYCFQEQV